MPLSEQTLAEQIVNGWMNLTVHPMKVHTSHYREMGIGVACTSDGKNAFCCVVFGEPHKK